MTMIGITVDATNSGQRPEKSHLSNPAIRAVNMTGNVIAAEIEASETYRHIRTTTNHTISAKTAQIVK
jgi:predicted lipoprotein